MADAVMAPDNGSSPAAVAINDHTTRLAMDRSAPIAASPVIDDVAGEIGGESAAEEDLLANSATPYGPNREPPSLVARYFSESARYPLLSHSEERTLCSRLTRALKAIAHGLGLPEATPLTLRDVTESVHADSLLTLRLQRFLRIAHACRDQLIRSNLRLAVHIARRHARQGILLTDLIQDGNVGLIKAVERFCPDRGFRFSTYAYWWITEEVMRCVKRGRRVVRTPEQVVDEIYALQSSRARLLNRLGRQPSAEELAQELGISTERTDALMRYASPEVSTNTPITNDSDLVLGDVISGDAENDPAVSLTERDRHRVLEEVLSRLNERERDILQRRFGLGRTEPETLQVISERLAISRERVRQIEKGALAKLREQYASLSDLGGM